MPALFFQPREFNGAAHELGLVPTEATTVSATVTPAVVAAVSGVPGPTFVIDETASPAAVASVWAVPAATPVADALFATVVASVWAVPAPSEHASADISPAAVASVWAVPAPTFTGTGAIPGVVVASIWAVPAPSVGSFPHPVKVASIWHVPGVVVIDLVPVIVVASIWHVPNVVGVAVVPTTPRRSRRLGCGQTDVVVQRRGGQGKNPVGLGSTRNWTSLDWQRVINNASGCQVRIQGRARCCDWAERVVPWRDEIAVYRDGVQAWQGPVTEINWVDDELRVDCKDLAEWFTVRNIHNDHAYPIGTDVGRIFYDLVDDGFSVDRSPDLHYARSNTGVTIDEDGGRTYLASQHQYVNDALNELTHTGVDWTVVNRDLIVGGTQIPQASTLPQLLQKHFDQSPEAVRAGNDFGTRFHVSGSGRGAAGDSVYGTNVPDAAMEATYGVIERNFSESQIRDAKSAKANALSRYMIFGAHGIPQYVNGGELNLDAPVGINDLIPGRIFRIALDRCPDIVGAYRLAEVNGSVGPEHDYVRANFQPLGTEGSQG